MKPDPQTQTFLDGLAANEGPALFELPVEDARQALAEITKSVDMAPAPVARDEDRKIAGADGEIDARIYWPEGAGEGLHPIVILYHGGGWVLGDINTHDSVARYYCANAGAIVVNVDYRLAPEHKFPAGIEDAYAALCWVAENAADLGGDVGRVGVTGDSAGGNISAALTQMTRDRGGPAIAAQALVYPCTTIEVETPYASRDSFGNGEYLLSWGDFHWFRELYFDNVEVEEKDPRASPLLCSDLSGLPPAIVITAGFDMLRDEGKDYADRLAAAGVPVDYRNFEGTIHGFTSFAGLIDAGKEGLDSVVSFFKAHLA